MNNKVFSHLESIYRNYDIRGLYPEEINDEEVEKIGKALVKKFNTKKIAIGRDIRPSADALFEALKKGIISQGCDVVDLGLITTPMSYYVCGETDVDATVMITASHMPSNYNGLKISIQDARPVTSDLLQELRNIVGTHTFSESSVIGKITSSPPLDEWREKFRGQFSFKNRPIKVVIDPANMIGGLEIDTFRTFGEEIEVIPIYHEFDPNCPNHEANPIKTETLVDLGAAVRINKADLGIAFDGDADRVGFVDETGRPVSSDIIGALLAKQLLKTNPGAHIVFDPRSSRSVKKVVEKEGGKPVIWKVGHTNIRTKMRELGAVLGIELAGHFFFKETYYSEGGPLPAFIIMKIIHDTEKPLSQLVHEVKEFHHSGEINSEISRTPEEIYEDLKKHFSEGTYSDIDGLTIEYENWWLNVRPSANDPVLRLNLEADSEEKMLELKEETLKIINS